MNPGTIVDGKYRIDRQLGEGGMATVFAATHIHLNEQVAIKVLLAALAGNANIVERFMREARAAVRLKSEHVVRVKDVGSLPTQQPYIVMEFLDGTDLEALLAKRGKMPDGEVVDYILQVCEALVEAHAAGIVHRDIKPANCLLAQRNDGMPCVKVLDFGIAKMMLGDDGPKLTATSATMGTPAFMSPEQIRGAKDVDHRGDIWSVGVMLFELIMGRVPFLADTYGRLVMAVMREPSPPMPDSPPGLQAVIHKCLEKDRVNRYQSVAELAQALEPFASNRAEAAVIVQRAVSLARPRIATPPAGVPVSSGVSTSNLATPAHGNPPAQNPLMSTPAHGGQPLMTTPAQGMRPSHGGTHGGQPLMTTPAHGMRPTHGGTHGGQQPGHQPMVTPVHGMPPSNAHQPTVTPAHGMPPNAHQPMVTPAPMMAAPAYGMPPSNAHQPMVPPAHGMPPPGAPMMATPAHGMPPSPIPPSSTTPAQAKSSSRVLLFVVIGLIVGSIAGAVILFGT